MKDSLGKQDIINAIESIDVKIDWENASFDTDLYELGLDSLDFYNFLIVLEEKTGVSVSDEDLANLKTVNNILEYFNK